jgi:acyl-coenzyme A thioesterase PaaI-like protein
MIPAFFDNTFGPLSFAIAKKPTVSLDLNTTFIKTISPKEGELILEGKAIKITKRFIIFEGKAYNPNNELIATCTSRMMILG